jgi:hypothetical protein
MDANPDSGIGAPLAAVVPYSHIDAWLVGTLTPNCRYVDA